MKESAIECNNFARTDLNKSGFSPKSVAHWKRDEPLVVQRLRAIASALAAALRARSVSSIANDCSRRIALAASCAIHP